MCISPITLYVDGVPKSAACRNCWQCVERAKDYWVGRLIAESRTAVRSHFITLTYGRDENDNPDHLRALLLTYSDVQKYMKLLRFHGYRFRFFVAGEFGSKRGRAHWHVLIFWDCEPPPLVGIDQYGNWGEWGYDTRFNHYRLDDKGHVIMVNRDGKRQPAMWWPWGFSEWGELNPAAIRYACDYIQKDRGDDEQQAEFHMSKRPPIGAAYFERMAENMVRMGIAPQSLKYTFPEVLDPKGNVKEFMLKDAIAERFIRHYVDTWGRTYPGVHMPQSDLVDEFADCWAKEALDDAWPERTKRERAKQRLHPTPLPLEWPEVVTDWWQVRPDASGQWRYYRPGQKPLIFCEDRKGNLGWHEEDGVLQRGQIRPADQRKEPQGRPQGRPLVIGQRPERRRQELSSSLPTPFKPPRRGKGLSGPSKV